MKKDTITFNGKKITEHLDKRVFVIILGTSKSYNGLDKASTGCVKPMSHVEDVSWPLKSSGEKITANVIEFPVATAAVAA